VVTFRKATEKDVSDLSKRFLQFLEDKKSKIDQENVARFGVPEEYVREALADETLIRAAASGKAVFHVGLENNEVVGFAQTVQRDTRNTELDRIVVFPAHERRGIGTRLLQQVIMDEQKKGTKTIAVNAGKEETHARRFYEKNGFKLIKETTIDAPWGEKLNIAVYKLQLTAS